HASLLRRRPRAPAPHPAADDRARPQPRRRRARDPARGADPPDAADDGAPRAPDARDDHAGAQAVPPRPRSLRPHGRRARAQEMDFQRLTVKSQEAIAAAQELARRRGNPEIVPTHLLLALLDQELPQTLLGEQAADVRAGAEAD